MRMRNGGGGCHESQTKLRCGMHIYGMDVHIDEAVQLNVLLYHMKKKTNQIRTTKINNDS